MVELDATKPKQSQHGRIGRRLHDFFDVAVEIALLRVQREHKKRENDRQRET